MDVTTKQATVGRGAVLVAVLVGGLILGATLFDNDGGSEFETIQGTLTYVNAQDGGDSVCIDTGPSGAPEQMCGSAVKWTGSPQPQTGDHVWALKFRLPVADHATVDFIYVVPTE